MGLFDEISSMVSSALGGEASESLVMEALQSAGVPGVGGLIQQLQQSGLGAHVASWMGSGPNQPVSATEIQQALGGPTLDAIAGKLGVDPAIASTMLSRILPGLVDRATPDGQASAPDQAGPDQAGPDQAGPDQNG